MKQMMFAKEFPKTHPRAGEPTRFVEKIWAGLADQGLLMDGIDFGNYEADFYAYYNADPKVHTIREGRRWKQGEFFVGKIWSGAPYRSKTISFTHPIKVVSCSPARNASGHLYKPTQFWKCISARKGPSRKEIAREIGKYWNIR